MSKHTPGPWHDAFTSEKTWHKGIYDAAGNEVAVVKVKSAIVAPRRDADARLIAAAPAMYAYVEGRADAGDSQARALLESIHACR